MSTELPVTSVPVTMADKIKAFGNLSLPSATIKQVTEAIFNWILSEAAAGRSVTIPKVVKFSRKLLKGREFRIPGSSDPDAKSSKPARHSFHTTVSAATKKAFEALEVSSDEQPEEEEEEEVAPAAPTKPAKKAGKEPAAAAPASAPKGKKAAPATVKEIDPTDETPAIQPPKAKKEKKSAPAASSKVKKSKAGGSADAQLEIEPYANDIDDGEFSDGM